MGTLSPFACDITAIPAEDRAAHRALIRRLLGEAMVEDRDLPNGLAFRFPAEEYDAVSVDAVSVVVGRERVCGPFRRFVLEIEPECGAPWLRVTGPEGAKAFIRAELGLGRP